MKRLLKYEIPLFALIIGITSTLAATVTYATSMSISGGDGVQYNHGDADTDAVITAAKKQIEVSRRAISKQRKVIVRQRESIDKERAKIVKEREKITAQRHEIDEAQGNNKYKILPKH